MRLRRIRQLAALERVGSSTLLEQSWFREKLAAVEIELRALEITQLRVVAAARKRGRTGVPDPSSSVLKIKGSELLQATTELMLEVAGPYALPYASPYARRDASPEAARAAGPDYAATVAPNYFNLRKVSIFGGTNEIQRNIIAKAILGL
jgi:alkylation response protein AidB-like acyl-CoA dehydrogenase